VKGEVGDELAWAAICSASYESLMGRRRVVGGLGKAKG